MDHRFWYSSHTKTSPRFRSPEGTPSRRRHFPAERAARLPEPVAGRERLGKSPGAGKDLWPASKLGPDRNLVRPASFADAPDGSKAFLGGWGGGRERPGEREFGSRELQGEDRSEQSNQATSPDIFLVAEAASKQLR